MRSQRHRRKRTTHISRPIHSKIIRHQRNTFLRSRKSKAMKNRAKKHQNSSFIFGARHSNKIQVR